MNAIIARPAVAATQATPAAREHKQKRLDAAALPSDFSASAQDWRLLVRPHLDETHDILLAATHPAEGPVPLGLPSELATHSIVALRELLCEDDASAEWQDDTTTLCALLWARSSMLAAVALLGAADDVSHGAADAYRVVSQRLASACAALELTHDLPAMSHELQKATVKPFLDQPQQPTHRAPTALEMEMLAGEAERIGLLVGWCINAHSTIEQICVEAKTFPAFLAELRERHIAFDNADWLASRMDECLAEALQRQSLLIRQMAGGAA